MKTLRELLERAVEIQSILESVKPLYAELDAITQELVRQGFKEDTLKEKLIQLVDNFENKNTVFRPAAVRRHELKVEDRLL